MRTFLTSLAAALLPASVALAADDVTLQLKWVTQSQFAGYYVALDKGFYEAEGLNVTIKPGGPDIAPPQVMAGGGADVMVDWMPSALAARGVGGESLVAVALLLVYVVWGSTYLGIHLALEGGVPPLTVISGARFVVAGGVLDHRTALHLMRTGAAGVIVGYGSTYGATTSDEVLGISVPMATAIADAAASVPEGGKALIVSHQLPIYIARLDAEGRSFVHNPATRDCRLASVTAYHFLDGRIVGVDYSEPAADFYPAKKKILRPGM